MKKVDVLDLKLVIEKRATMALKMYILIKDSLPVGHAILAAAHASVSCYCTFRSDHEMMDWEFKSFKKVICKVTDAEFQKAKTFVDCKHKIMTESSLDGAETTIVFVPRHEWPKFFNFLKLYK